MTYDEEAGYVVVPHLMGADEVMQVRSACAELVSDEAGWDPLDKPHQGTVHLENLHRRIPLVAQVIGRNALTDVVGEVLGSSRRLAQVSLRSPGPGHGRQDLHADDLPKLDDGPARVATAIVPLVDFTTTNGATRLVPGSHTRPDLQRRAGQLGDYCKEIVMEEPAGSAIVLSGHLLHSGRQNRSAEARPALQLVWRLAPVDLAGETAQR